MPKILLVEDNPGDARLISELLKETEDITDEFDVVHVERVSDATKALGEHDDISLILSDITLPDSSGVDTLKTLGKDGADLPIIFMTGTNDEALAIAAINEGAQDYLVKGKIDAEILGRAMQYATERKRFQNEMNQALANEEVSQQRIRLLAEQKRQLIRLNRSKDEFVSIASHQLRTPATAVKQYVGMVIEGFMGEIDPKQKEILEKAYESNNRQLEVISQLLKTAQLDSSQLDLSLKELDLTELLQECIQDVMPSIDTRRQTLVTEFSSKDCTICGDRDELKLVFVNLIENASKYTPNNKRIIVTTTPRKGEVEVSVRDEGVGIAKQDQAKIFDKFTRVDNNLSDTVTGTGLGLYWAKRIVRLHQGTIKVYSDLGQGSNFVVRLARGWKK